MLTTSRSFRRPFGHPAASVTVTAGRRATAHVPPHDEPVTASANNQKQCHDGPCPLANRTRYHGKLCITDADVGRMRHPPFQGGYGAYPLPARTWLEASSTIKAGVDIGCRAR